MEDPRSVSLREALRTGACPGAGDGGYVPIVRAVKDKTVRGYFVGDGLLGVQLHWDSRSCRLVPCRKDRAQCLHCQRGAPCQWKGYGAAAIWPQRSRRIIEVPEGAYRACAELAQLEGQLRGYWWELRRFPGPTNNAPVQVKIQPGAPVANVEAGFDVMRSLLIFWGLNDEERGKLSAATLAQRLDDGCPDC
jgi:hypothetical protein